MPLYRELENDDKKGKVFLIQLLPNGS
jgi:hypothetical protein